jgi:hypothetical protein
MLILIVLDEYAKHFEKTTIVGAGLRLILEVASYFANSLIVILFIVEGSDIHRSSIYPGVSS